MGQSLQFGGGGVGGRIQVLDSGWVQVLLLMLKYDLEMIKFILGGGFPPLHLGSRSTSGRAVAFRDFPTEIVFPLHRKSLPVPFESKWILPTMPAK